MLKKIKVMNEYIVVYGIGSVGYSLLEVLWRGFTHWTMTLTGGLCLLCIYITSGKMKKCRLWVKCLTGSAIITAIEFTVGCIVNRILHWGVWDYSNRFLNVLGQICLLYTLIWFLLCIPAIPMCGLLQKKVFKR